jgi:hypothetical protein
MGMRVTAVVVVEEAGVETRERVEGGVTVVLKPWRKTTTTTPAWEICFAFRYVFVFVP